MMPAKTTLRNMAVAAFAAAALLPAGCRNGHPIWTQAVRTPDDGWRPADKIVFSPDSQSVAAARPSRMVVFLRYRQNSNIHDMRLAIDYESEAGMASDTLVMPLFRPDGSPVGRGGLGILEVTDTVSLPFAVTPGWEAVVAPIAAEPAPTGIQTFGITLIP